MRVNFITGSLSRLRVHFEAGGAAGAGLGRRQ
jgi:hypothetical protein